MRLNIEKWSGVRLLGAAILMLLPLLGVAAAPNSAGFEFLGAPPKSAAADWVKSLSLQFQAEAMQSVQGGIRTTLSIHNTSPRPLMVTDADSLCRLEILDAKGWPVSPPPTPDRLRINSKAPHTELIVPPQQTRELQFAATKAVTNANAVYGPGDQREPNSRVAPVLSGFPAGEYRVRMYCTVLVRPEGVVEPGAAAVRSEFVKVVLGR